MTPEERQLVEDLFERLAELEGSPRDAEAERLIRDGLARAPNALYALVQTVLLQDEGLRAADERIAELEEEVARAQAGARSSGSFLGERRGKWNTGAVLGGSVPSVRPGDAPMGAPSGFGGERGAAGYRDAPYGDPAEGRGPGAPAGGGGPWSSEPGRGGGSFLGTAAAVAAGAIGGGLLMGGIKSALGGHGDSKGPFAGALDQLTGGRSGASASGGGSGDLARDAGLGDIGRAPRAAAMRDEDNKEQDADRDSNVGYDEDSDDVEDDETEDFYDEDNE